MHKHEVEKTYNQYTKKKLLLYKNMVVTCIKYIMETQARKNFSMTQNGGNVRV